MPAPEVQDRASTSGATSLNQAPAEKELEFESPRPRLHSNATLSPANPIQPSKVQELAILAGKLLKDYKYMSREFDNDIGGDEYMNSCRKIAKLSHQEYLERLAALHTQVTQRLEAAFRLKNARDDPDWIKGVQADRERYFELFNEYNDEREKTAANCRLLEKTNRVEGKLYEYSKSFKGYQVIGNQKSLEEQRQESKQKRRAERDVVKAKEKAVAEQSQAEDKEVVVEEQAENFDDLNDVGDIDNGNDEFGEESESDQDTLFVSAEHLKKTRKITPFSLVPNDGKSVVFAAEPGNVTLPAAFPSLPTTTEKMKVPTMQRVLNTHIEDESAASGTSLKQEPAPNVSFLTPDIEANELLKAPTPNNTTGRHLRRVFLDSDDESENDDIGPASRIMKSPFHAALPSSSGLFPGGISSTGGEQVVGSILMDIANLDDDAELDMSILGSNFYVPEKSEITPSATAKSPEKPAIKPTAVSNSASISTSVNRAALLPITSTQISAKATGEASSSQNHPPLSAPIVNRTSRVHLDRNLSSHPSPLEEEEDEDFLQTANSLPNHSNLHRISKLKHQSHQAATLVRLNAAKSSTSQAPLPNHEISQIAPAQRPNLPTNVVSRPMANSSTPKYPGKSQLAKMSLPDTGALLKEGDPRVQARPTKVVLPQITTGNSNPESKKRARKEVGTTSDSTPILGSLATGQRHPAPKGNKTKEVHTTPSSSKLQPRPSASQSNSLQHNLYGTIVPQHRPTSHESPPILRPAMDPKSSSEQADPSRPKKPKPTPAVNNPTGLPAPPKKKRRIKSREEKDDIAWLKSSQVEDARVNALAARNKRTSQGNPLPMPEPKLSRTGAIVGGGGLFTLDAQRTVSANDDTFAFADIIPGSAEWSFGGLQQRIGGAVGGDGVVHVSGSELYQIGGGSKKRNSESRGPHHSSSRNNGQSSRLASETPSHQQSESSSLTTMNTPKFVKPEVSSPPVAPPNTGISISNKNSSETRKNGPTQAELDKQAQIRVLEEQLAELKRSLND